MSNWAIRVYEEYFSHILEKLKTNLIKKGIIHTDETTVQVLKEDGQKASSKSYMWLYRTGEYSDKNIVIFDYNKSRSGDVPKSFLRGYNGLIHTDGYVGYNKLKNKRIACLSHIRRKFVECLDNNLENAEIDKPPDKSTSLAEQGKKYCDKMFILERDFKALSIESRYLARQEKIRPILDDFKYWLENTNTLKKSQLGKAINYALNNLDNLYNYLEDGRCSISNNVAENAIRPFVIGRKGWLFCNTPRGAKASACIYSIVETAKANKIDSEKYMAYILNKMPSLYAKNQDDMENLMPWSPLVKDVCALNE